MLVIISCADCKVRLAVPEAVSRLLINGSMRLSSVRATCWRSAMRLAGVDDRLWDRRVVDQPVGPLINVRVSSTSSSRGSFGELVVDLLQRRLNLLQGRRHGRDLHPAGIGHCAIRRGCPETGRAIRSPVR